MPTGAKILDVVYQESQMLAFALCPGSYGISVPRIIELVTETAFMEQFDGNRKFIKSIKTEHGVFVFVFERTLE